MTSLLLPTINGENIQEVDTKIDLNGDRSQHGQNKPQDQITIKDLHIQETDNEFKLDWEKDIEPEEFVYNENGPEWACLPDLVLEKIFGYLDVRSRYAASLVCRRWYWAFYMPRVWNNFIVDDMTLTQRKYNYYAGWQYTLNHERTQQCLIRVGRLFRCLDFRPVHSFNNLYQFMTMLTWYIERKSKKDCQPEWLKIGDRIRSVKYEFPCNMSQTFDPDSIQLFGTGGQLLKALKVLLSNLTNLRELELVDFVLERFDANHLLDEVLINSCTKMRILNLVNATLVHCPIPLMGLFINLQILTISPQNIDDEAIKLLSKTTLQHLYIFQNVYTPNEAVLYPCSYRAWRMVKANSPTLKVHLRLEGESGDVVIQPEAPVYTILYKSNKTRLSAERLTTIAYTYYSTLTAYGHGLLPKFNTSNTLEARSDLHILAFCRACPQLDTLIIREKMSTATILLIAKTLKYLRNFHVLSKHILFHCDLPDDAFMIESNRNEISDLSDSLEAVENAVSQILGIKWHFLNESEFEAIDFNSFK